MPGEMLAMAGRKDGREGWELRVTMSLAAAGETRPARRGAQDAR